MAEPPPERQLDGPPLIEGEERQGTLHELFVVSNNDELQIPLATMAFFDYSSPNKNTLVKKTAN